MSLNIPDQIADALALADPSWHPVLLEGLRAVSLADPDYLPKLAASHFLPTGGRLFAAFRLPLAAIRYVLVGEGPYPREASATGVCFMDGAVGSLWSEKGLSKQVNRATSLRNFMKLLLVADGRLEVDNTSGDALAAVSAVALQDNSPYIQTLAELQEKLIGHGFLLLNASLVFRDDVAPVKDAKAWRPFLNTVLEALAGAGAGAPTLVLWGKIAEQLNGLTVTARFPKAVAEHPYNISFISNPTMRELFAPMRLLERHSDAS